MSGDDAAQAGAPGAFSRFVAWIRGPESDGWIELVAVLLLSTASLTAAWSGYQAAVWGGQQATFYSEASARRVEAVDASTTAYLYALTDMQLFNDFAEAFTSGDVPLMDFYERQFPARLQVAYEAWRDTDPLNDPDAPANPFVMSEYRIEAREDADRLSSESEALFADGVEANRHSKAFVLNTVYLATVLFMAGIAAKVRGKPGRVFLIALGGALLVYGLIHAAGLPTPQA